MEARILMKLTISLYPMPEKSLLRMNTEKIFVE